MGPPTTYTGSGTVAPPHCATRAAAGVPIGTCSRLRTCHLAGDRDHAPGHRVPVHGPAHGIKRADVGHHGPHIKGQAERRDGAAEQFVHQDVLVARRVEVVQFGQLDAGPGDRAREHRGDRGVFALDRDDAADSAHGRHHGLERPDDLGRVAGHDVLVRVEQRLAFAAVGDDGFDRGVVLDVGRKPGPAFADHPGIAYRPDQALFVHSHVSFS